MKSVLLGYIVQDGFGLHEFHAIDFHHGNLLKHEISRYRTHRDRLFSASATAPTITSLIYFTQALSYFISEL